MFNKFIANSMMIRLKDKIFRKKSNDMIKLQPVSLISVISLIFFWSIGIILSSCILIIEKKKLLRKMKKLSMVHNISWIKSSGFQIKTKKRVRILPNITRIVNVHTYVIHILTTVMLALMNPFFFYYLLMR